MNSLEKIGCSQPVISRIFSGKQQPGTGLLKKVAAVTGVALAASDNLTTADRMIMSSVYTTAGTHFTHADHQVLAALILDRFGHNKEAAAEAWRRMLGNNTTIEEFMKLAEPGVQLMHVPRKLWN